MPQLSVEIVKRSDIAKGFQVLPRRWVVERTLAWLNRSRRLAKDFENLNRTALAFIKLASIRLMLRKTTTGFGSMRQATLASVGFERFSKTTRRAAFLAEMEQVVPRQDLYDLIAPFYLKAGKGRPPVGLEQMLRIYFLRQRFNLSDPGVEEALHESVAMRRNCRAPWTRCLSCYSRCAGWGFDRPTGLTQAWSIGRTQR